MNSLLEQIDRALNSMSEFFHSSNLQMCLLIGTGLLTIGLLILALTRWGHSRPLWKCVVLSVTAHILLLGYAYGTRLILKQPLQPHAKSKTSDEQSKLEIRLVDQHNQRNDIRERIESERMSWNEFGNEQPLPKFEPLARPSIDSEILIKRETPSLVSAPPIDRFTPMPKREDPQLETAAPELTSQPPEQIAATETPSPGMLRVLPRREQVEASPSSTQFVDDLFDREAIAKTDTATQPFKVISLKPTRDNPLRYDSGQFSTNSTTQSFVTTNRSPVRAADGKPLPKMYGLRSSANRLSVLQARGGSVETEQAVEAALLWLANHQDKDGRWDASKYGGGTETKVFGHDRDGAGANADTGVSGLALLSFLAGGHSHLEGPWQETVRKGLRFLTSQQDSSGCFAGEARLFARMYCHSMALLAVSEAYALTGDDDLRAAVKRGVDYSINAQHRHDGGWRYQPGDQGDMSQFGWQALAIHSAELGGIDIPQDTMDKMYLFLDSCAAGKNGGLAAYRPGHAPSTTMTAESLAARYVLGQTVSDRVIREAKFEITGEMPSAQRPNLYYWYYGTMALYFAGGPEWEQWNEKIKSVLLSTQQHNGDNQGSWNPDGVWASYGGRVYSTAISALMLEVYYRYLPTTQQPSERFAAQEEFSR